VSGTPPFAQLIFGSPGPGVEDSNYTLFTRHSFFVFFGGAEVVEALVGVLDFRLLFPLSLVDCL
jgi:hypothetical protein